jgi:hypothetical protein
MSRIVLVEQASPATPSAGQHILYPKTDGYFYHMDDTGTERRVGYSLSWEDAWSAGTYNEGQIVRNDGAVWIATTTTTEEPTGTPTDWDLVVEDGAAGAAGADGADGADGAPGAAGADGADGTTLALSFTSDTGSTSDSDNGNGLMWWNNATQSSATVLYFDNQTADAISLTTLWGNLGNTGFILMVQADDATKWQLWRWTAAPVDGTGYRKFTSTLQASGGSIADNKTVYVSFSNDRTFVAPRTTTETSNATPTPNADTTDIHTVTAQSAAAAWAVPTGTPVNGQVLILRMKDNGTARAVSFDTGTGGYRATTEAALPTTTVLGKELYSAFIYDSTAIKWDHMGSRNIA